MLSRYSIAARTLPFMLLTLSPFWLLFYLSGYSFFLLAIWLSFSAVGIRHKACEARLRQYWGGTPTWHMLRDDPAIMAKVVAAVGDAQGAKRLEILTACYINAVGRKSPILLSRCIEYGFWRNCYGFQRVALWLHTFTVMAVLARLLCSPSPSLDGVIFLLGTLFMVFFWGIFVTEDRVKRADYEYGKCLFSINS